MNLASATQSSVTTPSISRNGGFHERFDARMKCRAAQRPRLASSFRDFVRLTSREPLAEPTSIAAGPWLKPESLNTSKRITIGREHILLADIGYRRYLSKPLNPVSEVTGEDQNEP